MPPGTSHRSDEEPRGSRPDEPVRLLGLDVPGAIHSPPVLVQMLLAQWGGLFGTLVLIGYTLRDWGPLLLDISESPPVVVWPVFWLWTAFGASFLLGAMWSAVGATALLGVVWVLVLVRWLNGGKAGSWMPFLIVEWAVVLLGILALVLPLVGLD